MRRELTRERLQDLMIELARSAPHSRSYRVYIGGGGTAVHLGWRESTIDADLHADHEGVFRHIQAIKERLQMNVEFVKPEDFVPPLAGSDDRHLFIQTVGKVSFYHHDPYAQLLSKIVRGFRRDLDDARNFLESDMVDAKRFRSLVHRIPETAYARYPALSRQAVVHAVDDFLQQIRS
ncbi:MAG: DUF6036 family nucleotidyltransferase [Acidobacteriota bacterium]